ncbi:hypothetical protein M231_04870 [Tremella mesenterica]|uniref:Uncharacterized protein n=1 Tax=Tremella mesenterica TaxID=5217 RepID=A0A4Q1BJW2_TREME|nr:hypothetical protein M231_04870 [Tremella mesenterica]
MSDSTGLGVGTFITEFAWSDRQSGGLSPLYTVANAAGSSCDLRSTAADFEFYLNETSVNQCENVQIYWDKSAVAPVRIIGAIPGGQVFQFVAQTSTSLAWKTNIAAGTQFLLAAFDAGSNGQGGSSALLTVGGSSDNTCLDDSSPSSTPASSPSNTASSTSGGGVKTVTAIATSVPGAAGLSAGAIAGIVVAAVVCVIILQAALLWFCCRRQIAALRLHRKQMRGREVKPDGDVDLVSTIHGSVRDDDASMHSVPNSRAHRLSDVRTYATSARIGQTGRSSVDDRYDAESSISPFMDGPRIPGLMESIPNSPNRPYSSTPWDSPGSSNIPMDPPRLPHIRTGSLSSNTSLRQPLMGTDEPLSAQARRISVWNQPQMTGFASGSGNASRGPQPGTKAHMAATMSATNPDHRDPLDGMRLPPQNAPPRGFRRHEDAGPADAVEDGMEDLPPMYDASWETRSERGGESR